MTRHLVRASSIFVSALVAATALAPRAASAQTIFTNFQQPGSTFLATEQTIFLLGSGNWLASSFLYGGPTGAALGTIRFAAQDQYQNTPLSPLNVTFRVGATMATSVALESWTIPDNPIANQDLIYTVTSAGNPSLVSGSRYWLELSVTGYAWGWNYNSMGALGNTTSADGGATWIDHPSNTSPVFEVNAIPGGTAQAVTPEPATMSLVALGLVGMAGIRRRKKAR